MKKISLIASGIALTCSSMAQHHPNIIYILADDMGYGDIQYLNKKSQIPTPNLDRLCSEGMHFTEAHSGSAVSTPTRYGIVTGRYCFRSSLKKGVLGGFSRPLIEKERITAGHVLKQAGYETAIVGKWHLGLGWERRKDTVQPLNKNNPSLTNAVTTDFKAPLTDTPNDHGFDYSYIIPASLDMDPYVYIENRKVVNPEMKTIEGADGARGDFWRKGLASEDFEIPQTLDHFTDKATAYITDYSSDKPFFLYFPMTAPHSPWVPADKYKGMSGAGVYGDFVCHVDDMIGRMLEAVDKKGIRENTLIIFTSDNGSDWKPEDLDSFPKHRANHIFRGQKSDAWEGGHHVPFIVRWPAVVRKGSVSKNLVCLTDFTATCASITGQQLAEGVAEDSHSFLPILQGKANKKNTRGEIVHHAIFGMFSLRQGQWKFIDGHGSGGWSKEAVPDTLPGQLYNMKKDPTEQKNLYAKYPELVKELKARLEVIRGED
ncbi:MAG: arylsulfatase [Bacteroidales bacterium]|jgi:arylsulfatase A-like enzyme